MKSARRKIVGVVCAWCAFGTLFGAYSYAGSWKTSCDVASWPTECVQLLDGRQYHGYIESTDEVWVYLTEIRRPSGRPMFLVNRPINRGSIAKITRLEPQQREKLKQRIMQFRNRTRIEAGKMKDVRLKSTKIDGTHFQSYRGKWFSLDSTTDEATTRRIVVRVEQVFAAYRHILALRVEPDRQLRFVVFSSLDEYQTHLSRIGLNLRNQAVFIPNENIVLAGSELSRYIAELDKVNARHNRIRLELEELDARLQQRLHSLGLQLRKQGKHRTDISRLMLTEKRRAFREIKNKRIELRRCDRENVEAFNDVTRKMFAMLYHEAFHAYLENYVFPSKKYDVPIWLNEGLAVLFEAGLLEADTLRVDAPNATVLKRLKADLRSGKPMSLAKLIEASPREFLISHDASAELSNRYYVYAWGLAYYLTFEKGLLGGPRVGQYVARGMGRVTPKKRFEKLVGIPLHEFEPMWRAYILSLR